MTRLPRAGGEDPVPEAARDRSHSEGPMEKEPLETSTQVPGQSGERRTEGERGREGDRGTERVRNFSKGTQPVPWVPPTMLLSSTLKHSTEGQNDTRQDQKTRDSKAH